MKNKLYKTLIPLYALLTVVLWCLIVYCAGKYNYLDNKGHQYALSVAICLLGAIVGGVVHTAIHELGHLIPLFSKAVIMEFSVFCFSIRKTESGYKKSFSLKNKFSGYVSFVGKEPKNSARLVFASAVGAFISTVSTLFVFLLILKFIDNYHVYCFFGGASVYVCYSLLVNFLSAMPTSDGRRLMLERDEFIELSCVMETESRLYYGESLIEMDEGLFANEERFVNGYYSYLKKMQQGQIESAKELLAKTVKRNEETHDNQPIALDLEIFYHAVLQNETEYIEGNKDKIIAFCDEQVTPTTLRVMIAYRKLLGEAEWEKTLRVTFSRQADGLFKGLFLVEKSIVERFS